MNINISNNELNLINFTGKIVINEDDNTVSFLDVILREPEEMKSVAEYCKAISLQAHEIKLLKEDIKELNLENEQLLKYKETIDEVIENQKEEIDGYLEETNDIADVSLPFCDTVVEELKLNKIIAEVEKENPILDDCDERPLKIKEINKLQKSKEKIQASDFKIKNIEEGIIKFFKSRGKKTSFKYHFSTGSNVETVQEAKEIQSLCQTSDNKLVGRVFRNMISDGRIIKLDSVGKGYGKYFLYSLNEYMKPKSCCPKCNGFSLVRNENKYSSDEDYYHDKDGYYFTCLSCGEELEVEEGKAA